MFKQTDRKTRNMNTCKIIALKMLFKSRNTQLIYNCTIKLLDNGQFFFFKK